VVITTLPLEVDGYFLHEAGRASFNPDGSRIVTPLEDDSRTAAVWDTTSGEQVTTLTGHTDRVLSAAFSPDGATIVTTSGDYSIRLWDASTP
jgi:WD40 repeat protein